MSMHPFHPSIYPKEGFFNPATSVHRKAFIRSAVAADEWMAHGLSADAELAERYGLRKGEPLEVLEGGEFEINLFSKDYDPEKHARTDPRNPNKLAKHKQVIQRFARKMEEEIGEILLSDGYGKSSGTEIIGDTTLEVKTRPMPLPEYIRACERLAEWVQANADAMGFYAVVYSEHGHTSMRQGKFNPFSRLSENKGEPTEMMMRSANGMFDMWHRALPLVRLPGEIAEPEHEVMSLAKERGIRAQTMPVRIEGRLNSSLWAHDPMLNLALRRGGMMRGLKSPLMEMPCAITGEAMTEAPLELPMKGRCFERDMQRMQVDEVLRGDEVLGRNLDAVATIIDSYPKVSSGDLPLGVLKQSLRSTHDLLTDAALRLEGPFAQQLEARRSLVGRNR